MSIKLRCMTIYERDMHGCAYFSEYVAKVITESFEGRCEDIINIESDFYRVDSKSFCEVKVWYRER